MVGNDDLFQMVKEQVPASLVLDEVLGPSRRGRWVCPFHDDHNPSLSERNGGIRCWSCAWTGDVIRFVGEHVGLSPLDALHHVANIGGLVLPSQTDIPRPSQIQILHKKIRQENDRLGKAVEHQAKIAFCEGWRCIFRERHGDQEKLWAMADAACALERTILNGEDDR